MERKILVATMFVVLLILNALSVSVEGGLGADTKNKSGNRIRLLERLRYRIRDVLGRYGKDVKTIEVNGTLEYNKIFFRIGDAELHFGPKWYTKAVISAYDYDGDGDNNETVHDELLGLVDSGQNVTVQGYLQAETWLSVFTINGLEYRGKGKAIWASNHTWRWKHNKDNNRGQLVLHITDAPPGLDITKAVVNISEVEVHMAGLPSNLTEGKWITVVGEPQTFDLIALKDAKAFLGSGNLSAGWYTQIRLNVNEAILTIDGENHTAKILSKTVKIVRPFKIEDGKNTNLTLDFDIEKSVHKIGQNNYIVRPTIKLLKEE